MTQRQFLPPGEGEYRFINLFRALAAFWVLAAHCQIWGGYRWLPIPDPKLAVDLFMLVSGFLMAANTSARWDREPMDDPRNRLLFWLRRFFRIAPVYYLVLLIVWLGSDFFLPGKAALQAMDRAHWPVGGRYDPMLVQLGPDNLLAHLSFLFGLVPRYAASTSLPDWSIGLEMQFYFAFPFLYLLLRKRGVVGLVVCGFIVYYAGLWYAARVPFPEPSLLLFRLHYFLAGTLLFVALRETRVKRICAMVAGVWLASLGPPLVPALLLAMLTLALLEREGALLAWVDNRVVRFASNVSYSVYLTQGLWVGAFGALFASYFPASPARTLALFAFVVVGAYATGSVLHRWVEQPGIALGKRLVRRLRPVDRVGKPGLIGNVPQALPVREP